MHKITVPYGLHSILHYGDEATLSELKRGKVDRIFIYVPSVFEDSPQRKEMLANLSEKLRFFEENGLETGVWVSPLLGFGGDSEGHTAYTSVRKLHDGTEYVGVCCPLDPAFVEGAGNYLNAVAKSGAKIILLDDEYCLSGRSDGGIGCCCDKHLRLYADRVGEYMTPEEIRNKAFFGEGNKYRDAWMDLQGETLRHLAEQLREAVNEADPSVRLGFCAGRTHWDVEGIDAIELAKAFAGDTKPILRLAGGPWWARQRSEVWAGGIAGPIEAARLQAYWCIGENIEIFSEGDVFPRPRFDVPANLLEGFDMVLRADGNLDGCLKYMLDYFGEPTYETGYIDRHARNQHLYQGIDSMFDGKQAVGVNVFENMFLLRDRTFPDKKEDFDYGDFPANNNKCRVLPTASQVFAIENSLPMTYGDLTVPTLVFGENACRLPEDTPYLIVDGRAAEILRKRGVDVGLVSSALLRGTAKEVDAETGENEKTASSQIVYRTVLKTGANVRSYYVVGEEKIPAMYLYENEKGQKFAVYTFDAYQCRSAGGGPGRMFAGYGRQRRLYDALQWLTGKKLAATSMGNPFLHILSKEKDGRLAVGLWNFFEDEVFEPTVQLGRAYENIRFLNCDGVLGGDIVRLSAPIMPFGFAAFEVW
ncbi:MAG: hypothetical protein E7408_01115 [Ruminococcaceae bacterium]|nr:hypothetical protein [Oscillospiraceae bacterium]